MEGEIKGTKRNLSVLGWIELHWGVLHFIFSALKKNDIGAYIYQITNLVLV